jgi:hypothetical protein
MRPINSTWGSAQPGDAGSFVISPNPVSVVSGGWQFSEMATNRQIGYRERRNGQGWLLSSELSPSSASSSSYPDGHIDDLAAQVGNVLANVFGTELVCRTVEILRQLHADVVRAWLRAPVA